MDDFWVRVALIVGVVSLAVAVALIQRRRSLNPVRAIAARGFAEGVYFFSSVTCTTCAGAREKLQSALGSDGFTEITWEHQPEVFDGLGVDAVPAVMLVETRGRGRLYLGQPDKALQSRLPD